MEIRIGGREVPMLLSCLEMAVIQEELGCTVGELRDRVFGLEMDMETDQYRFRLLEDPELMRRFGRLIRILGNAGLEEAGKEPDLTDKWVMRHIRPTDIMRYVAEITGVINQAMRTENTGDGKDGPVDEVLAEENRKKEQRSLHTGESAPADSSPD